LSLGYPLVSAVILNFNGKTKLPDILLSCISSVLNSDYPNLEVLFFDNGSTDNSTEFVKHETQSNARLKIITIRDNCGPAMGYNKAVEHAKGKYVVILNNDVELEPDSISELVSTMEGDPSIGIANSKIMFFDRCRIQTVGNMLDLTLCTFPVGTNEKDNGQYDLAFEPTFPPGSCMIIRRSLIERIGLFDPSYLLFHDDIDFGLRTRLAGFKVLYVPSSIAYHVDHGTICSSMDKIIMDYYSLNSRVGLFIKNFEYKSILRNAIPMSLSYILTLFTFIRDGSPTLAFKSFFWRIGNFKNDWKRRQFVQMRIRKISDKELFKNFINYNLLISGIKSIRLLKWFFGNQSNFANFLNMLADNYYRNHKTNPHAIGTDQTQAS
jgi:GT2 family glycosyltransferase